MVCVQQGALGRQPKPPQHLMQTDDVCRGGSLPNVKFASNNSIDLQVAILSICSELTVSTALVSWPVT